MSRRIALITATPQSLAAGSGTFFATDNLRQGLESLGYDVTVIHPGWSRLPRAYALRRWRFNVALDASALHGAGLVVGIDLDGFAVAHKIASPFVSYIHGQLADEASFERGVTRWSMLLQARWERRAAERATRVATLSDYAAGRIHELYGVDRAKIAVVPPGFDVAHWAERVRGAAPIVRPPIPTVLAVARLYARKNLGALVDAAHELSRRGVSVQVRIVGDGPERKALTQRSRSLGLTETVKFLGFVSDQDLPGEFARADLFCLPSLQEGFGLVFVQAMAAGLPIVAFRASSTPELITHGVEGLLTDPREPHGLAQAIHDVLANPNRARYATAGRNNARRFSRITAAKALIGATEL